MALRSIWNLVTLERLRRPRPEVTVLRLSGVIGGFGPLRSGMSLASLEPPIDPAFAQPPPKAVALVVNSPGGSAAQSALIAKRTRAPAQEKDENGRAHLCTPVTNANTECRLLRDKKKN